MRLPVVRLLLSVCALLAVVPAAANAATAPPKVTSVAPLKLKIGDRLTIRGKGFLAGKNRNTVLFKATGSRAVFVKAETATATKIVVKVPAKLLSVLKVRSGASVATKFQLRVLARRLSPAYTPAKGSPTIAPSADAAATTGAGTTGAAAAGTAAAAATAAASTPATVPAAVVAPVDTDGDGTPDSADTDDDNDFLLDTLEATIGTSAVNADTDGDGMADGWEYQSAIDLNGIACPTAVAGEYPVACPAAKPYPTRTRYPNPLFADVSNADYDHDGVPAIYEYTAWKDHAGHSLTNMWYSDGKQASVDSDPLDGCRGMDSPNLVLPNNLGLTANWVMVAAYRQTLDLDGDGCLSDDERDEDGDLLTNYDEISGRMSDGKWWAKQYQEEGTYPDADGGPITGTTWLDPDTDGDGIVDGLDDQDHDDFLNVEELERGPSTSPGDHSGLWVNPFNPCLPWVGSATCDRHPPFGADWAPFATTITTYWPVWRSWNSSAVYHDDVVGWNMNTNNPAPPSHLIAMPGQPFTP